MAKTAVKQKIRKNVAKAVVHIKATFNNTLVTITDTQRRYDLPRFGRNSRI